MDIQDAQRESRSVYIGGFWGQLVSSVIWLVSAALGTWVTPKASILTVVIGGFFIFPLTQMLLRLSGRPARVSQENSFHWLGMQVAFVLPFSMLLLVPVGLYRLNWSRASWSLPVHTICRSLLSTGCACSCFLREF